MRRFAISATLVLGLALPAAAQQAPDTSTLTLARVFSREFALQGFGPARWLDADSYTTLEPSEQVQGGTDLVRYDAATGRRELLVPATKLVPPGAQQPLEIEDYGWSPDGRLLLVFTNSARVWRYNTRGDYWVLDVASGKLTKLGGPEAPPSSLMFAKFSPDSRRVAYVRQNNLYVEDLGTGKLTPLTTDGSRTIINGTFDWVNEEELNLRDGFRWSPDGERIAYWQLDASGVRDFDLIDDTDSLYSFVKPVQYPKAGTTNSAVRVGSVSAAGGATTWLKVPGDPRNNYIARMEWAASPTEVVLQHMNRRQDTIEVMLGDVRTGEVRTVLTERDSAWVDVVDDLRWLDGGRRFTWVSERDGWRHLYVVSRDGRDVRLVTKGAFDLANPASAFGEPQVVGIDSAAGLIYFTASPTNATQLYLYRTRLNGSGDAQRVTPAAQAGSHLYQVGPGARYAFHTWSAFGKPPRTELVHLPDHRVVRTLVDNAQVASRLAALRRGEVEFFQVDNGQGTKLDAYMMKPPGFDPSRKYPVLFNIYGGPASQTVLDAWGGRNYLWHLMLSQQGYIVASVDNRGTPAPKGRAFRKAIAGDIGSIATADQTAAARAIIAARPYVDAGRIAVWGWSGGGTNTLNLLFRSPDIYRTGMSVAPVTDERLYDTIYQERYMGLPEENAEGYRKSSPLTYVDGLRGNLLVVHGSGDDNVHFQNTEMLVNALVAAGKPFQMMDYPNRTHCICEGRGTTLHLYSLLTRYLHDHLPAAAPVADATR
ncbi:MAG TPA: S9 family peptidase [Longimicrobiales bacterium]|nr:S9 family peptidase [Longimicrobiales bacterium]